MTVDSRSSATRGEVLSAMPMPFQIAGGSVTGQAHAAAGRNNQDAFSWEARGDGIVAVVCDGCGAGAHSEVGAKIGARLVAEAGARRLASEAGPADLLEQVRRDVLRRLRLFATGMSADASGPGAADAFARTVLDHFLFTVVGAIVTRRWAATFSLGDGLVILNGERRLLGPFPENEPPYLAYALLTPSGERPFEIHRQVPVDDARSVLLASDGAVDLEALADTAVHGREEAVGPLSRYFANRDMVRRRLAVVSRGPRGGLLPDDTTLVVVRRREEA
jgi:hypothetical protein